jgi:hypothetical protein
MYVVAPFALALAACQTTGSEMSASPDDALRAQLSGKTIAVNGAETHVNSDGSLSGAVQGTWTIEDGKYCRTIVAPKAWAGTQCQGVSFDGNQVTFTRPNGKTFTGMMK